MNKNLIILSIFILLICVGLSGCQEVTNSYPSDESRFVGTWKASQYEYHTFFSDGTCLSSDILPISGLRGMWEIKEEKLVITHEHSIINSTYDYYFSENNSKLHLKNIGGENYKVYTKQ
jgi:hypothetical protein